MAADAAGHVLIISEGHGRARVQRRDAHTGRLIAQSPIYQGVTKPYIGGVFGGGVWISAAGGMTGYIQRLALRTLRPTPFPGAPPHPGIIARSWARRAGTGHLQATPTTPQGKVRLFETAPTSPSGN